MAPTASTLLFLEQIRRIHAEQRGQLTIRRLATLTGRSHRATFQLVATLRRLGYLLPETKESLVELPLVANVVPLSRCAACGLNHPPIGPKGCRRNAKNR